MPEIRAIDQVHGSCLASCNQGRTPGDQQEAPGSEVRVEAIHELVDGRSEIVDRLHGAVGSRDRCRPKLQDRIAPCSLSVPGSISRGDIHIPVAVGHRPSPAHPYSASAGKTALSVQLSAGLNTPT